MSTYCQKKRSPRADSELAFMFCTNGCVSRSGSHKGKHGTAQMGRARARFDEYVMGHHTAGLCEGCARDARRAWAEAVEGW